MNVYTRVLIAGLVLFGVALGAAPARPVGAAAAWQTPPPHLDSVDPASVPNTTTTTLVIRGRGFTTGTVALLSGVGALATETMSDTFLTAVVPAGLTPGTFSLSVIAGDAVSDNALSLTITGPTATPMPTAFVRPLLTLQSYGASSTELVPGTNIDFELTLVNQGQAAASNVAVNFVSGDLAPRVTGGVRAVPNLGPGETARIFQPFSVASSVAGNASASLEVRVSYFDVNGNTYTESFVLTFAVAQPRGPGATRTPTPTSTPRVVTRPQLVISGYRTDVQRLQPGARFVLELDVENMGVGAARRVTMIAGGGTSADGEEPNPSGTPGAGGSGGVSGAGGDFSKFAPVGSGNVQSLGEVGVGDSIKAAMTFVVNSTTEAGAYPMKFSFVYVDPSGINYVDDQVVTLLVYQPPQVDVNYYQQPVGPLFTFQPGMLPVQIVNLGRKQVVMGNMRVSSDAGQLANNVVLVGPLDPGGFNTLDVMFTPEQAGPVELQVTVDYTDDFNQPQTLTRTLTVDVMEMAPVDPGIPPDGGPGPVMPEPVVNESLWGRFVRFLRGLFGLDSAPPTQTPGDVPPGEMPPGEMPPGQVPVEQPPVVAPKGSRHGSVLGGG